MAHHPLSDLDFKTYLFQYHYDGAEWGFQIKARSLEEAKARLARLGYATYQGEVMMKITVPAGGFFHRLYYSLKNRLPSTRQ
ncbi:hypothetical protein EPO44_10065 [bacterium]|nr:MAG: hypothetical protein EPO44_10065 [bacterium]